MHSILQVKGLSQLSDPVARSLAVLGLIMYFSISAFLVDRYFSALVLDKPLIIKGNDWSEKIRSNVWLVVVCFVAVMLHINSFSVPEVGYLRQGLWMYDFSNSYWSRLFDIPIQYGFWVIAVLLTLIVKKTKAVGFISNYLSERTSPHKQNYLLNFFFILSMFAFFTLYSYLFPYSNQAALQLLRFPPVSHLLYLINYYAFGVSDMGPRIMQLIFYVLGAIYIYRTILLFREKNTALLGATIYLFSPILFHYASYTFLASGKVFFMSLISFHFLRFIKDEDNRDLVLTVYFIGLGFLYRGEIVVLFMVCFVYFVLGKIIKKNWHSIMDVKILLLSLISIIPFLIIGKSSGVVYYEPALSNLISFDYLFMVIQSQLSVILSFLLLLSIVFILLKRDDLSLFYGLYFIAYYVFFALNLAPADQRYSTVLYPAITVLLAQFIYSFTKRIRYKHFFKLSFFILTAYMIFLCLVPRSSTNLVTFKYKDFESQQYPIEKAADWIRNNTRSDEKILFLSMPQYYKFYTERIYPYKDMLNSKRFIYYPYIIVKDLIYPIQKLKKLCYEENISYILFPFGPNNSFPDLGASEEVKYLSENMNKEFTEISKFNYVDNYILVYKPRYD